MIENAVIVIMAGGAGERFWPLSNRETPKQLLRLHGDKTLLQMAFDRGVGLVGAENVFIVAGERLREAISENLSDLPGANYIAEPMARNTTACLGLAACHVERSRGPQTVMGVLTSDHLIDDGPVFHTAVEAAMTHAAAREELVTIGIEPTEPDTAFGYARVGAEVATISTSEGIQSISRVDEFLEKPDLETAKRFLAEGNYLWNSGMFFWRVGVFLDTFSVYQPEMAVEWHKLRQAAEDAFPPFDSKMLEDVFHRLPSLPIDKAIMEKSDSVSIVTGRFGWQDVGSWDALARVKTLDEAGNCSVGAAITLDSGGNVIYNSSQTGVGPEVVIFGVDDLVIVRTDKAILITAKSKAQQVKRVVRHLGEIGREDLL